MPKPIYFKSVPRAGKASPRGFADGLNRMAFTLRELEVLGGRVEWTGDRAVIIPPDYLNDDQFSEMFSISDAGVDGNVLIRPGMWIRDGHWNATRRARDYQYEPLTGAGVAANYDGSLYCYAILQHGAGVCLNGWNPDSLDPDYDGPSTLYDTWVPDPQGLYAQGLEIVFLDQKIRDSGSIGVFGGFDPQEQFLFLGEIRYDSGSVVSINQGHSGPKLDTDPLWRGVSDSTSEDLQNYRPYILYDSTFINAASLYISDGKWYSPRDGQYITVPGNWVNETLATNSPGRLYATVLPTEGGKDLVSPDPALVPDPLGAGVLYDFGAGSQYRGDLWRTRKSGGQHLLAEIFGAPVVGDQEIPIFDAVFFATSGQEIVNYYERPDSKPATGLTTITDDDAHGRSIGYVPASVSSTHEGETEVYNFSKAGEYITPAYADLTSDLTFLVRDIRTSPYTLRYVDLSSVTFPVVIPPGSIIPGDMDGTANWGDWIDGRLHDHGGHEAASLLIGGHHPWAWANGTQTDDNVADYTRNHGTSIGSDATTLAIDLTNRGLFKANGTTESVDWEDLELKSGSWKVTDTSPASGTGAGGALIAEGGISAKKGIWGGDDGAGVPGGQFDSLNRTAILADETNGWGGWFTDGTNTLTAADGTNALTAAGNISIPSTGVFSHLGNPGSTIAGVTSGGIDIGTAQEIRVIPAGGGAPINIRVSGVLI